MLRACACNDIMLCACACTDASLRPYVAFNAELRGAFQAIVTGLEKNCRGLVRHALNCATCSYTKPLSLAPLSLDDANDPEDLQNVAPATVRQEYPPATQIQPERRATTAAFTVCLLNAEI